MPLALSDMAAIQISTSILALVGTIMFPGIMAYLFRRLDMQQQVRANQQEARDNRAAAKVDQVKMALEATTATTAAGSKAVVGGVKDVAVKIDGVRETVVALAEVVPDRLGGLEKVAKATHTLVNSNYANQLLLNKTVTRRLAEATRDPDDRKAADLAAKMYADHMARQAAVDAQPGTDDQKKGVTA